MDIDNVHVVGKYNIVNDSVSLDHVDFEATTTHKDLRPVSVKKSVSPHNDGRDERCGRGWILAVEMETNGETWNHVDGRCDDEGWWRS